MSYFVSVCAECGEPLRRHHLTEGFHGWTWDHTDRRLNVHVYRSTLVLAGKPQRHPAPTGPQEESRG